MYVSQGCTVRAPGDIFATVTDGLLDDEKKGNL